MKWFLNITTRAKLFISLGLMVAFLITVILIAYHGIAVVTTSQNDLFQQDFIPALDLVELKADQNRVRAQLLEMMLVKDKDKLQALEKSIRDKATEVDVGVKRISAALQDHPQELRRFGELLSTRAAYVKTRDEQIDLIKSGKIREAEKLGLTIQEERYKAVRDIAIDLGNHGIALARARIVRADKTAHGLSIIFLVIGLFALLLSLILSLFLSRIIAKPLSEITSAAQRISTGDLTVAIPLLVRNDEVGNLTRAFGTMIRYLQEMATVARQVARGDLTGTVKPMSDKDVLGNAFVDMTHYFQELATTSKQVASGDLTVNAKPVSEKDILGNAFVDMITNLRKITTEIRDGVSVLASSACEILASTTQVASGMIETSTSVSETTATVEEVKQTALLSVEKSRGVSDSAQKAALVAKQGRNAVNQTMEGMNHIKGLMDLVVESIMKLSEQTLTIGEIITAVNDLAQQSNLLAVNAAIEASKAGEHGKGFSVVAQEIKSLADQSKQATEQVRTILAEIQKATGSAVMAAEQVSKAVDTGTAQATESGESIRKLTESISEAAQAATQIAASSQQQLAGMEQVAQAMESIKQAAQQNTAGTRQTEQAAHNLNEFGQKLKEMVGKYRV